MTRWKMLVGGERKGGKLKGGGMDWAVVDGAHRWRMGRMGEGGLKGGGQQWMELQTKGQQG